jgi:ATP phosphoribosyltransferase
MKTKKCNFITPEGTRDLLFEECTVRREIETKLMELFRENGYSEVITPFVEFYDVFDSLDCRIPVENMYKLTDSKGRLMVIRPDSTLPIIRLAQTRLKDEPRPLKLCYNQTIYRANPKEAGRDDEIAQCGIELIGGDDDDSLRQLAKQALQLIEGESDSLFETIELKPGEKLGYYTGAYFNGYIAGYGKPVISGGRYKVGDVEAQGFAVNVTAVARCKNKTAGNSSTITIALTKGRIEKESIKLFERMGWDVSRFADKGRKLVFELPGADVQIVIAKSPDVITFVENGDCDIGITGKDMLDEYGGKFIEMLDLGFGKCRFALAAKVGTDFYAGHEVKTVASKYTNVARTFFEEKGVAVDIKKIEGSVELAPLIDAADGIVDLVETGATLKENGLTIVEYISDISARVIVNPVKMKMKEKYIGAILKNMEGSIPQ